MEHPQSRIAILANKHDKLQTLMQYVNEENLRNAHKNQKSKKASGVDNVSKEDYDKNLDDNIDNLMKRLKAFSYYPQPVLRTYIPKDGSDKMRPLGIPAYEDKLVQSCMAYVLNEIYETKFLESSYGFRRKKNCHQAVKFIQNTIFMKPIQYVVDADIKGFFDNVDHDWMMKFLEHDIQDKHFLLYIKRFLKTGMIEELKYYECDKGTPQGGLISPVLANVYLHYVLDVWFAALKKAKRFKGEAYGVRYADDNVWLFEYKEDAEKFYDMLKPRLEKFGLQLAEEKSKIIRFGKGAAEECEKNKRPETFDFLGFTFICGKTRKGNFTTKVITSNKKLKVKRQNVKKWLHSVMHEKIPDIIKRLNVKLRGHYQYYGVSGNIKKLQEFMYYVTGRLFRALKRRSQRSNMTWERFNRILTYNPIEAPKIYVDIWKL
jgi:group II intron reverse transcriptase/maturase